MGEGIFAVGSVRRRAAGFVVRSRPTPTRAQALPRALPISSVPMSSVLPVTGITAATGAHMAHRAGRTAEVGERGAGGTTAGGLGRGGGTDPGSVRDRAAQLDSEHRRGPSADVAGRSAAPRDVHRLLGRRHPLRPLSAVLRRCAAPQRPARPRPRRLHPYRPDQLRGGARHAGRLRHRPGRLGRLPRDDGRAGAAGADPDGVRRGRHGRGAGKRGKPKRGKPPNGAPPVAPTSA